MKEPDFYIVYREVQYEFQDAMHYASSLQRAKDYISRDQAKTDSQLDRYMDAVWIAAGYLDQEVSEKPLVNYEYVKGKWEIVS